MRSLLFVKAHAVMCCSVFVFVSISGNGFLAEQNRSSNLVFMQLACLSRISSNEGESVFYTAGVQVEILPLIIICYFSKHSFLVSYAYV